MKGLIQLLQITGTVLFGFFILWALTAITRTIAINRKRLKQKAEMPDELDITDIASGLTREELKKIVLAKKESTPPAEEKIDLDTYEELPLKPKVYFDPERDLQEEARPKIQRSFVSNAPINDIAFPDSLESLPTETSSVHREEPIPAGPELSPAGEKKETRKAPLPHPFEK